MASYPFDDSASHEQQGHYSQTADDGLFRHLASVYSRHHPVMSVGKPNCSDTMYETFKDGITNGAQWYDVPGMIVYIRSHYMDHRLWFHPGCCFALCVDVSLLASCCFGRTEHSSQKTKGLSFFCFLFSAFELFLFFRVSAGKAPKALQNTVQTVGFLNCSFYFFELEKLES